MASASMGVEGMTCASCCAAGRVAPDPELTKPAGSMPVQLVIVLALMAINIGLSLIEGGYISVALNLALMAGVLAGNHGVRKFLLFFAWVNLVVSGILCALIVLAAATEEGELVYAAISTGIAAFTVWALSHPDVREWMFKTAFKDGL